MNFPFLCRWLALGLVSGMGVDLELGLRAANAAPPPLLIQALEELSTGAEDLAFTQHSRQLSADGRVKVERLERYDPSLPDHRRWRLIEVNDHPATDEERRKWEAEKNAKPRKKALKSPAEYLDLAQARLIEDSPERASFEVPLRPVVARLLAVEKINVIITVDRKTGRLVRIGATLREPIRVLLGLARITDLDVDVHLEAGKASAVSEPGDVKTGSTARATLSKLGTPTEYRWSDFERVTTFVGSG